MIDVPSAPSLFDDDPTQGLEGDDLVTPVPDPLEKLADPFDPLQIKISRRVVTVEQVVKRIRYKEIELAPDFQRRARIWDIGRKSRLIESLLLRIPLPVFYVAADAKENWRVVDGLQRLTTIYDFMDTGGENQYTLRGLEYLSDIEGVGYESLPRGIIRRIDETELNINIIESGTPDRVMFNIFKRLNTGGMSLNNQEIRHALNPGHARNFLIELSTLSLFQHATSFSVKDDRMGARELVLRFIAFYLVNYKSYVADDLDGFLNEAMRQLNIMSGNQLLEIKNAFESAMYRSLTIFDDDAFRKRYDENEPRKPINRALFESWAVSLSRLTDEQFDRVQDRKRELRDAFSTMLWDDDDFASAISVGTGNRSRVYKRFEAIEKLIGRFINV
jgi:hypothetical protein